MAQPCEAAFRVSAEPVCPNEGKGYFSAHSPLTTTSAGSGHVLQREDKAQTEQPAEKPLLTLAQHLDPKC